MSSPKPEAKMSVEQQVKAGLRSVKDFLAGRSGDPKVTAPEDRATRDVVAAELLAKMSGSSIGEPAQPVSGSTKDPQTIPGEEVEDVWARPQPQGNFQSSAEEERERERARRLFLDHGYFDEAILALRAANVPAERVAAARTLGLVGNQRGTAHLIAAMFDDDPEVRQAAEESLSQINDPMAKAAVDAVVHHDFEDTDKADSPQSVTAQQEGQVSPGLSDIAESALIAPTAELSEDPVQQAANDPIAALNLTGISPTPTTSVPTVEEEQLLLEGHRLRESVEQLALQLFETTAARKQLEHEVQSRTEREASLRAEAVARRLEEEEIRKQADQESERRQTEEREALTAEQVARGKAEMEAQHLAEEEIRLRLQAVDFRLAIAELAHQRLASETARRETAEAAREAEAKRARDEAKARHDAELARLSSEEEALRTTTEEIAVRLTQVEAAREKADAEAERLIEAQQRMRAAAEAGAQAEAERARLEAEIQQRTDTELRLLEETRRRGQEEQDRVQEEMRRHAEDQQHRLTELELMRTRAEAESKQLSDKHQQILNQVNSLRFADSQTRKRIEDAEVRRHAAEAAYRLLADKVQRVEAEAHARAKEEEQMLAKLEAERRTVAVEAQSRAVQEKRIREEIEMFRRLEEQERPRLEAAILQRAQAEARLQQLREHRTEARSGAGEDLRAPAQHQGFAVGQSAAGSGPEPGPEPLTQASALPSEAIDDVENIGSGSPVTPSILAYLNSVDPYKRAAAVAEIARSHAQDAFSLIAHCFDDPSPHVRNAAARALRKLEPDRTVDLFNRALQDAPDERRRNIGAAIAASGLAAEAINNLVGENREETYNALSILFVMAKTGEVAPLVRALEEHPGDEIGKAVMKLLTLSGHSME